MTTSRMVVVLRRELGVQHSLAYKELVEAEANFLPLKEKPKLVDADAIKKYSRAHKIFDQARSKVQRLQKAAESLGAIQLGDIEDKEF